MPLLNGVKIFVFNLPIESQVGEEQAFCSTIEEALKEAMSKILPEIPVEVDIVAMRLLEDQRREDLLSMRIEDYLTDERYRSAGVDPRVVRVRAIYSCLDGKIKYSQDHQLYPVRTVRELCASSRTQLLRFNNFGKKTLDALQKVLDADGLGKIPLI